MLVFRLDPEKESGRAFVKRVTESLYPKGAKHCMVDCRFSTGYDDGSGAYCNHKDSPCYGERVRSWDTADGCNYFEEGERVIPYDEQLSTNDSPNK